MKASLPFKYIIADKKGKNYVVFDFKDDSGKRKRKWVTTDLPADCCCTYRYRTAEAVKLSGCREEDADNARQNSF